MKQTYLVVFEKSSNAWGVIAPDVAGTYGLGETVDEARQSLREGIGYVLEDAIERGLPIPEGNSTSIDFSEFDPIPSESQYIVEWLTVEITDNPARPSDRSQQAA